MKKVILSLLLFLVTLTQAFGADIYVGSAPPCDTSYPRYSTIQSAISNARVGDTIKICDGTYPESITVNTGGFTITSASGDRSKVKITSSSSSTIRIYNTAPLTISNITIENTRSNRYAINVGTFYSTLTLDGLDIISKGDSIYFKNPLNYLVTIKNSKINSTNSSGIFFNSGVTGSLKIEDMDITSYGTGIHFNYTIGSPLALKKVKITSTNNRGISFNSTISGNLTIEELDLTSRINAIYFNSTINNGVTIKNSKITSQQNQGIYFNSNVNGEAYFDNITVSSKEVSFGVGNNHSFNNGITIANSTFTSSINRAINLNKVNGKALIENVNAKTTTTNASNNEALYVSGALNNGITIKNSTFESQSGKAAVFKNDIWGDGLFIDSTQFIADKIALDLQNSKTYNPVITNSYFESKTNTALSANLANWTKFHVKNSCFKTSSTSYNHYGLDLSISNSNDVHINNNCFYAPTTSRLAKSNQTGYDWQSNYWDGNTGAYNQNNIIDNSPLPSCASSCGGRRSVIAEYRFDECSWSGVAGEVKDSSGNNLHGQAKNGASTNSTAKINRSGYFPNNDYGSNTNSFYVEVNDNDILSPLANTREMTISAWIYPTSYTPSINQGRSPIVAKGTTMQWEYALYFYDGGRIGISVWNQNGSGIIEIASSEAISLNRWSHITGVVDFKTKKAKVYVNGVLKKTGAITNNSRYRNTDSKLYIATRGDFHNPSFRGYIDEVKIFNVALSDNDIQQIYNNENIGKNWNGTSRPPVSCGNVDHYEIIHDGIGLTCQPEKITLKACIDINTPCQNLYDQPSKVKLLKNGSDIGDYNFTGNTEIYLSQTSPATIRLSISDMAPVATNGYKCYNTSNNNDSCDITFYDSGFVFDIPDDFSCKPRNVSIKAVRKDDQTQKCIPGFQNKTIPVNFSYNYISPNTGTIRPVINNNELNTTINLPFNNNGESSFVFRYADAGEISVTARYDNGTINVVGTDNAVLKPYGFYVFSTTPNWEAENGANSTVFKKAGEEFNLSARAVCWQSDTDTDLSDNLLTPNYQKNNATVSHTLVSPTGGNNGTISVTSLNFTNGVASVDNQKFSEVGIIKFTVTDNDYLGTGPITGTSANIGRFIPDHFELTESFIEKYTSDFVYMGNPFELKYTIQAKNTDNNTTLNYTGEFAKGIVDLFAENNYDGNNLINRFTPALSSSWGNGSYSFFDNVTFTKDPANLKSLENFRLGINVTDPDGPILINRDMKPGAASCTSDCQYKIIDNSTRILNAILDIQNAYGPANYPLNVPAYILYYDKNGKLTINAADNKTTFTISNITLSNWTQNLKQGDTDVVDLIKKSNGYFEIKLKAPGTNKNGSVTLNLSGLDFLKDTVLNNLTQGIATFGIFGNQQKRLYWKEVPAK